MLSQQCRFFCFGYIYTIFTPKKFRRPSGGEKHLKKFSPPLGRRKTTRELPIRSKIINGFKLLIKQIQNNARRRRNKITNSGSKIVFSLMISSILGTQTQKNPIQIRTISGLRSKSGLGSGPDQPMSGLSQAGQPMSGPNPCPAPKSRKTHVRPPKNRSPSGGVKPHENYL